MLETTTNKARQKRLEEAEQENAGLCESADATGFDAEQLSDIARRFRIDLIVLFGSRAKNRARPDSDVDIGVWFERPEIGRDPQRYEAEREIRQTISRLIPSRYELDIVFLNGTQSLLLRQIATTGVPLYARSGAMWPLFRLFANRRYRADEKYRRRTADFLRRRYGGRVVA